VRHGSAEEMGRWVEMLLGDSYSTGGYYRMTSQRVDENLLCSEPDHFAYIGHHSVGFIRR